jgi:asparagine synthase (glutamine-hydrolysing)
VSGLGGLIAPPGGQVGPAAVWRLARALEPRGSHGTTLLLHPGVAFVHAALREPDTRRPELWRRESLWLAWDGRLDNRDGLDGLLGDAPGHDLHRLALAYERWGLGFLDHIEGDFALALWDSRARRLVLARDGMGVRPLFYAPMGHGLAWGSTLRAVRAASGASGELDEEWVAGYFANAVEPGVTPFRAVRAVPPGHALVLEDDKLRSHTFWEPGLRPPLRLPDDRAYEERFEELFVDAVRCRLNDRGPVAAELSGGLDSSSIVCVADRLIRDLRAPATQLLTLSWVYPQSPTSDERRFIELVEEHIGRPGRHLTEDDGLAFVDLEAPDYDHPTALECLKRRHASGAQVMWARGARVLLSGFAGDHVLHSEFPGALPLADLAWSGRLREFAGALRRWHELEGTPYPVLLGSSLALLLPDWMRRRGGQGRLAGSSCLDPAFARRMHMKDRLARLAAPGGPGTPGKQRQIAAIRAAIRVVSWLYDTGGWPHETAYPFLHRPLVEFCLSVPGEQFMRPGQTRSLHRRALRSWLPERIAERQGKRGPDEALMRELAMGWDRVRPLLAEAEIVRRGFVDPQAFRRVLDEARFGRFGTDLLFLLKAIALEAWLRAGVREEAGGGQSTGSGGPRSYPGNPRAAAV